ncbi:MAG: SBBP repeat-containing protein [Planctomycetota bacterium JB042]
MVVAIVLVTWLVSVLPAEGGGAAPRPPDVLFHEFVSEGDVPVDWDVGPRSLHVGVGSGFRVRFDPEELTLDFVTGSVVERNPLPSLCMAALRDADGRLCVALLGTVPGRPYARIAAGRWGESLPLVESECDTSFVGSHLDRDGGLLVLTLVGEREFEDVLAAPASRFGEPPPSRYRLTRIDREGTVSWSTELPRAAGGNGRIVTGANGTIVVALECDAESFEPTFDLASGVTKDAWGRTGSLGVIRLREDGHVLSMTRVDGRALGGCRNSLEEFGRVGNALAVDGDGSIFLVGATTSASFEASSGAFMESLGAPSVRYGFVTKLTPDASRIEFATLLGGAGGIFPGTTCTGVDVDSAGRVHVVGWTDASDFPTTPDALRREPPDSDNLIDDGFLAVLDRTGSRLLFATRVGDTNTDDTTHRVDVADHGVVTLLGTSWMGPYSDYERSTETGTWVMRLRLDLDE